MSGVRCFAVVTCMLTSSVLLSDAQCDSNVLYFPCKCDGDVKNVVCDTFADFQRFKAKAQGALKTLELESLQLHGTIRLLPRDGLCSLRTKRLVVRNVSLELLEKESLKGISGLEQVDLSHNQLRLFSAEAAFSSASAAKTLRVLLLNHNSLEHIRGMQGLQLDLLDLSSNSLSDVEVLLRHIPNITAHLVLIKNAIRTLGLNYKEAQQPLIKLTRNVTWLDLSRNKLNNLEETSLLKRLPYLTTLDLSANRLSKLEFGAFSDLRHLQMLNLSSNFLPAFDLSIFHNLTVLKHVDLSRNILNTLTNSDPDWEFFPVLETLNLQGNRLLSLSNLDLPPYYSAMTLNLGGNPWRCDCALLGLWHQAMRDNHTLDFVCSQPPFMAGKELLSVAEQDLLLAPCDMCPRACRCQKSKRLVDCRYKGLIHLPEAIPDWARVLQADGNQLESLYDLLQPAYCHLEEVSVRNNSLITLLGPMEPVDSDGHMESQSCASSVRFLTVRGNKLNNISDQDLSLLPNLQQLDLSMNQIVELPFHPTVYLPLLWELDLSYNALESLPAASARAFPHLRVLNLSSNSISDICFLPELPELESLDLCNNQMEDLRMNAGETIHSPGSCNLEEGKGRSGALRMVDVSKNKLSRIEQLGAIGTRLSSLAMGDNPWDCSPEHAHLLLEWSKQNEAILEDPTSIRCHSGPSEMVGLQVLEMHQAAPLQDGFSGEDMALTASLYAVAAITAALILFLTAVGMRTNSRRVTHFLVKARPKGIRTLENSHTGFLLYATEDKETVLSEIVPHLIQKGYTIGEITSQTSWIGIIISHHTPSSSTLELQLKLTEVTEKFPSLVAMLISNGDASLDLPSAFSSCPRLSWGSPTFWTDLERHLVPQSNSSFINPAFSSESCYL